MLFKFHPTKVDYLVNEEKKVVTCIVNCLFERKKYDAIYEYQDACDRRSKMFKRHKFVGTAKCSDNDVFDVARGKDLALARAKQKAFRQYRDIVKETIKKGSEISAILANELLKLEEGLLPDQQNYIEKLENNV